MALDSDILTSSLQQAIKAKTPLSPEQVEELFEGMTVASIEVGGMLIDRNGNKWAVPADSVDDLDDLRSVHPLAIPDKLRDPHMHYQTCHLNEVPLKQAEGFVPVTREEAGLGPQVFREYGQPDSTLMRAYDTVLLKIPKVIAARRQAAKTKVAREVVEAVEPTEQMLARARAQGHSVDFIRKREEGPEPSYNATTRTYERT